MRSTTRRRSSVLAGMLGLLTCRPGSGLTGTLVLLVTAFHNLIFCDWPRRERSGAEPSGWWVDPLWKLSAHVAERLINLRLREPLSLNEIGSFQACAFKVGPVEAGSYEKNPPEIGANQISKVKTCIRESRVLVEMRPAEPSSL